MYHGIEIQHPLNAMMLLYLIIAFFLLKLDLIAFFFVSSERFVSISNANSGCTLFFHCTCWCVTSIIRYLYICQTCKDRSNLISSNIQGDCIVILAEENVLSSSICHGQLQVQECAIQNISGYVLRYFYVVLFFVWHLNSNQKYTFTNALFPSLLINY
jgi:hypothetical protein